MFPEHIVLTLLTVLAFVVEEFAGDFGWRAAASALLCSIVAWLSIRLAYNLRLMLIGDWYQPALYRAAHAACCTVAIFGPLVLVARTYSFRSRRMLFVSVLSLGLGCFFYTNAGRSTDWRDQLWMEYSSLSMFSIGAFVGSVLVAAYETFRLALRPPVA